MLSGVEDKQQAANPTSLNTPEAIKEAQQDLAKRSLKVYSILFCSPSYGFLVERYTKIYHAGTTELYDHQEANGRKQGEDAGGAKKVY